MDKKNRYISANYRLYSVVDGKKELEEQTSEEHPFQFISGFGISLDAFEQNIIGLATGSDFDFTLQPSEAFGEYIPEGVHKLERETFIVDGRFDNHNIYVGAVITLTDNEDHRFMAKVIKVEDDGVTIDTNHPLAGKTLSFVGKVVENRDATDDEVQSLIKHLTGGCSGCGRKDGNGEGCNSCGEGCGHCH